MSSFALALSPDNLGVPTTKSYRVPPMVSRSAICACNRSNCSIPRNSSPSV
jgi:hypothetical protein